MSINKKRIRKLIGIGTTIIGVAFIGMSSLARKKKLSSVYDDNKEQKNPFEGKRVVFIKDDNDKENADGVKGHLEVVGNSEYRPGFYEKRIKRAIDVVLSFGGLVMLSPVFAVIALAIKIEDPGPVLFAQKRVGQNKKFFKLHKFRSMKMSTPHDVPTHRLENPDQYITKVGRFLRAHSLDELPQIWDIFIGNMSVIGPRPGLWNQDFLTAERDKYSANDVKPGLTGWAQINGRDELEIPDKAKLDGEYVEKLSLGMDLKCFLGSVRVFRGDDDVVEGGTGKMKKVVDKNDNKNNSGEPLKIWIFNNYNMLPEHGPLTRSYELGKALEQLGHKPVVFVGSHPHNTNLQLIRGKAKFKTYQNKPFPWILVKTCNYGNSKKRRILSMFEYYINSIEAAKHFEKPDVIIGSSAHPLAALLAIRLGRKYQCKKIVEIRDLWPESIVEYGILGKDNPLIKALYKFEKYLYCSADAVVFTCSGLYDYIQEKGWEKDIPRSKVYSLSNGIDLDEFAFNRDNYQIVDADLCNSAIFKVVYTGSIKRVNNLGLLLDAAKKISNNRVRILIWGDGDEREILEKRLMDEEITNVVFKGRVEKKYIPYIVSQADLNIAHNTPSSLFRFGISFNKMFEYLAAGKPVLSDFPSNYNPAVDFKAGTDVFNPDAENVAKAIEEYVDMPQDIYQVYCNNAIKAANEYTFINLANKLTNIIESIDRR